MFDLLQSQPANTFLMPVSMYNHTGQSEMVQVSYHRYLIITNVYNCPPQQSEMSPHQCHQNYHQKQGEREGESSGAV